MALLEDNLYRELFDAAVNAREDGDREEAAAQFRTMLERFPGDMAVAAEYAQTLISLKDFRAADAHLLRILEKDPTNYNFREIWATLPFQECDWNEQIQRDRLFRAQLPKAQQQLAKQSLIYTLAAYWESGRWADAAHFVRANQQAFVSDPDTFGMALQILGLLSRNSDVQALMDIAPPQAWAGLPAVAQRNLRQRCTEAERNEALVRSTKVRVLSIGQHCLPYQLGARWGFTAAPVDADDMTPFDLGAFGGNTAAAAIVSDFAAFADLDGFVQVTNWGGGSMYRHAGAGVHFHHERGPYWLENEGNRFFSRWHRMIANWRRFSAAGRRLFIFCLVGEGDLEKIVEAAERHLLDHNARLLVINVLKEHKHCPEHKFVTYLHAPYPDDYFWVELPNHSSERGFAFEQIITNAIRSEVESLAAEPDIADADYQKYRNLLEAGIDAREDGEPEASLKHLETLLGKFPGDAQATIEYVKTLRSLGQASQAEPVIARAIEANPFHFQLRKAWVDLPSFSQDWEGSIERARVLRAAFPPPQYPEAWRTLEIEYDFLFDIGQWNVLSRLVDENWEHYKAYASSIPGAIAALNNLFDTRRLAQLVETASPQAWHLLPPEALKNLHARADKARQNREIVAATGVRVISIGQNCLPYLVGGRWGLLGDARAEDLNPFDIGGFHGENVSDAIDSDFAQFRVREHYVVTGAYGGGQMFTHKPTNVGFFHERGPWWMNDPSRFFARIDMMLANWSRFKRAGKRLFVFCYCGAGDLQRLVEVADRHLLDSDSHLLIIDVLQEPHTPPAHERVSYVHVAYPRDYTWTKVADQVSELGAAFELSIVKPIVEAVIYLRPEYEAARAAAGRLRMLRAAAQKARAAGNLQEAVSLMNSLLEKAPDDASAALEQAEILRDLKRMEDADAVLIRGINFASNDYALRKCWAELPIHSANWDEAITRGLTLRENFPTHIEPRALLSLNTELSAFYDSGRWEEAVSFLHHNWESFTSRPELFGNALDMLGKLFRHHGVRDLLDSATPEAMRDFSAEAVASLTVITDAAAANQKRLKASNSRVISLGHNAHPYILAGRWGLNTGPARYEALTPFDIGGFSAAAAADAVATDFAGFSNEAEFVETAAWFGGAMLAHRPTGINFLSHRRASWTQQDRRRFFAHWQAMLANWRRTTGEGRCIFVMNLSDQADPHCLVRSLSEHLLTGDASLIIVDQHEKPCSPPVGSKITYVHAPPEPHYHWPRLTGCAHPIHVAYERKIVDAILARMP